MAGRVTEHAHAAVAAADWLFIPVKLSKADLDATAQFLDVVQSDMARRDDFSGGLLLNQLQEGTCDRIRCAGAIRLLGLPGF